MATTKHNRGRQIHYDQVPDDVYKKILEIQAHIKQKTLRGRVSVSAAITKLIRASKIEL